MSMHVGSGSLRYSAEQAAVAAESKLPILLTGETGTGKERFAHLIHRLSPRAQHNLVAVNCAAIPETLAETYLFGHMKGAFSGANSDKDGVFESAAGSTLFLDEIAELSLETQAKLLRVIQDGLVQRVGGTRSRYIDVRIIAATNRDLKKEVALGRFRQDLYFRLEVVQIALPALRERRAEIAELALVLLKQINQRRQRPRQLSKAALLRLEQYDWPGNVRQLSNVLERSVLYSFSDILEPDDLLIAEDSSHRDSLPSVPEPAPGFSLPKYLDQVRKQLFTLALAKCGNNRACAADLLGVSKQAVSKFVTGRNDNLD
jgi:transcriptional regulator with PAS, ATPase and Fis domain